MRAEAGWKVKDPSKKVQGLVVVSTGGLDQHREARGKASVVKTTSSRQEAGTEKDAWLSGVQILDCIRVQLVPI